MIKCVYGGPEFVLKALPVYRMTSGFLLEQCELIFQLVHQISEAKILAVITDGHRINQKFFETLHRRAEAESSSSSPSVKPWKGPNGTTLLYDYVHLLKCVRNNWITEKQGLLKFNYHGEMYSAEWEHLKQLYKSESDSLITLSKLTYEAVYPTPIERQKVSTCLKVCNFYLFILFRIFSICYLSV